MSLEHQSHVPREYQRPHAAALLRIVAYAALLILPLVVRALVFRPAPQMKTTFAAQVADQFGLLGFTILALQFPLAARFRWLEWPFGLDLVFRFHRAMAVVATLLLLAHPLIMVAAGERELLTRWAVKWPVQVGRIALLALLATAVLSLGRRAMRLRYDRWQRWHGWLAGAVLALGLVHSSFVADELATAPMRALWGVFALTAAATYAYRRLHHPRYGGALHFVVSEVVAETHDTWTVWLRPAHAGPVVPHLPGQFHYLTLIRDNLPTEEHPFTIVSSPRDPGRIGSTIKASGDFTRTIHRTAPGDAAIVRGPFGRFSHVLRPEADTLVFIAGGVGITPFMSMLRFMRDTLDWRRTLLIYGNRTARDILFRDELSAMVRGGEPHLTVVHVLSQPDATWDGERGYVTAALVARSVGSDTPGTHYFVCGPPVMSTTLLAEFRRAGIPGARVHSEAFGL